MLVAGNGVFRRYASGVSKNGYPYRLLELAGMDYEKCTISVPEDMVDEVQKFHEGDQLVVSITLASGYRGLTGTLKLIQKK